MGGRHQDALPPLTSDRQWSAPLGILTAIRLSAEIELLTGEGDGKDLLRFPKTVHGRRTNRAISESTSVT